jgi:hypothetical protein
MPMSFSSLSDAEIWTRFGFFAVLGVSFAIVFSIVSRRRGQRLVEDWARLHEVTIVSIRQPTIVPLWKAGRGWEYFRATLRDKVGDVRECWIRCPTLGLVFFGRGTDYVEVIDDKKS